MTTYPESSETTQLCCQVYWTHPLHYIITWITFSPPGSSKQRRLLMSPSFVLSNEQLPLRHWHLPTLFPEAIKCHFILLASQGRHGRLHMLTDICHRMEGIFRGDQSPFIWQPFLPPATSFPLDFPQSVYLIYQPTNDICLSLFPKDKSRGQMVDILSDLCKVWGTRSAQTFMYLKINPLKHHRNIKLWEIKQV